jgi:2,3-bisphosphoglycerate-independent phosphoglycerate mutase
MKKMGYDVLITADHGNAEYMIYEDSGDECPSHTTNPVIFILVSDEYKNAKLEKNKGLKDVAPTILDILNLKKPKEMEGESLIKKQ